METETTQHTIVMRQMRGFYLEESRARHIAADRVDPTGDCPACTPTLYAQNHARHRKAGA